MTTQVAGQAWTYSKTGCWHGGKTNIHRISLRTAG